MPCSRQLPAGILTAVNFKEVMTHEIWWWSSGDLLDVSADPLIEPYTYGIPRQQPSAVNELMGKEGRGDFFFSASYHILKCLTGWVVIILLNFEFLRGAGLEPRVVSCARDIKKIMTSLSIIIILICKNILGLEAPEYRKYRWHSTKVQGWDILGEMENLLLQSFWLKQKAPKLNFCTQWLLFETKCSERKGQTNSPRPLFATRTSIIANHNSAFN